MISPSEQIQYLVGVMGFTVYHTCWLNPVRVEITGEITIKGKPVSYSTINKRAEQLEGWRLTVIRQNNIYHFVRLWS